MNLNILEYRDKDVHYTSLYYKLEKSKYFVALKFPSSFEFAEILPPTSRDVEFPLGGIALGVYTAFLIKKEREMHILRQGVTTSNEANQSSFRSSEILEKFTARGGFLRQVKATYFTYLLAARKFPTFFFREFFCRINERPDRREN